MNERVRGRKLAVQVTGWVGAASVVGAAAVGIAVSPAAASTVTGPVDDPGQGTLPQDPEDGLRHRHGASSPVQPAGPGAGGAQGRSTGS